MKSRLLYLIVLLLTTAAVAQTALETAGKALEFQKVGRLKEAAKLWSQAAAEFKTEGNLDHEGRAWFYRAGALYDGGEKDSALLSLAKAKACFSELKSPAGLALVTLQEGIIYRDLQQWTKAESRLRESIEYSRQAGDEKRALECTEILGSVFEAGKRWPEATIVTLELVEGYSKTEPAKVPSFLSTLGALYQLQNDPKRAEKYYRKGIEMLREQERPGEALEEEARLARYFLQSRRFQEAVAMLAELRIAYQGQPKADHLGVDQAYGLMQMGQHTEALSLTEELLGSMMEPKIRSILVVRKLELLHSLKRDDEALALLEDAGFGTDYQRGKAAERLGRRDLAEQYYRQALKEAPKKAKPSHANSLAISLMRWGQAEKAAEILEEALGWPESQQAGMKATLTLNLGETYLKRGLPRKALPYFEQSVVWFQENGDNEQAATALNNLGATYEYLGDFQKALSTLEKAIEVGESFQKPAQIQGTIANATGLLYVKLGRVEDGIRQYGKALAVHQRFANPEGEIASWINLGAAYHLLDQVEKSVEYYEKALELAQAEKMREMEATINNNLGQLNPDANKALAYFQQALALSPDNAQFRAIVQSNMAREYRRIGKLDLARKMARQSVTKLQELGAQENEHKTRLILHQVALDAKDQEEHRLQLERLLFLTEDIVTGLSSRSARSFVYGAAPDFQKALAYLVEQGDWERCFAVEEKVRSLGLAALTQGISLSSAHIPADLAQRQRGLLSKIEALKGKRLKGEERAALKELRQQYRLLVDRIERHHLAAGALHGLHSATLAEVQAALQPKEALLEYFVTGNKLDLLVVTKTDVSHHVVGGLKQLNRAAADAERSIRRKSPRAEELLGRLGELVWAPATQSLVGVEKVVVAPAGPLFAVPFPALFADGQPIIEQFELTTAPSASAWLVSRQSEPKGVGALLGALGQFVPEWAGGFSGPQGSRSALMSALPASLVEVDHLETIFPSSVGLRGEKMTSEALRVGAQGKKTLHFATHGVLDQTEPMFSGLVAADRLVTAADIFGWKLDAELAVLSACHSGRASRGEEYVSLASAFQFAGARTLLVTSWAVSDEATAEWMKTFYSQMESGMTASAALRQAHLELRKSKPHPFYWAPFGLWGDGAVHPF